MVRAFLPALLLLATAGCASSPQNNAVARADSTTMASCRASTNRAFDRQNRYLISERDQTASPFSNSGDTGITTRGLSQRFDYDNQLASCLSASGGDASSPPTQPAGGTSTTLSR
jgi:hypothetical protein